MDVYSSIPLIINVDDLDENVASVKAFYNGYASSININR